jgi:hypothetical protein
MAITNRNDPLVLSRLVARQLDIDPARITDARQVDYGREWQFAVRAIPTPRRMRAAIDAAEKILDDPFRREVVKAAVPDVFAALTELVKQSESAFSNQTIRFTEQAIYELQQHPYDNRQTDSRHHRTDRPRLSQPSGQADHDPSTPLPPFYP